MTVALIAAGVFALTVPLVIVLVVRAVRRAFDDTDERCGRIDEDIDAGRPYRSADPFDEVEATVFDFPARPAATVIELPRRGGAA